MERAPFSSSSEEPPRAPGGKRDEKSEHQQATSLRVLPLLVASESGGTRTRRQIWPGCADVHAGRTKLPDCGLGDRPGLTARPN